MTDINEMHKWCVDARELLGFLDKRSTKNLKINSEAVLALLTTMEKTPGRYPGLAALKSEFEIAAGQAKANPKEKDLKKIAGTLHKLQIKLELAIGNADPSASPEVRKRVVAEARHRPVYENKLKRIRASIDELEPLPGTAKQVIKLQALLSAGRAQLPDYEAAYKALEGRTKQIKEGREKAETWTKAEFNDKLKKALVALRAAIVSFESVAGMGDTTRVETEQTWINDQLKALAGGSGDPKKIDKTKLELMVSACGTHTAALTEDASDLKLVQAKVVAYQERLYPLTQSLRNCAPQDELARVMGLFNPAQSLAGAQQFGAAETAFKGLDSDLTATELKYRTALTNWQNTDTLLTEGLKTLSGVTNYGGELPPGTVTVANQLTTLVQRTLRSTMVPARQYVEAVALVTDRQVLKDIETLKKLLADLQSGKKPAAPAFAGADAILAAQIKAFEERVETAENAAESAIAALEEKKGHGTPHRKDLDALKSEWFQLSAPFTNLDAPAADRLKTAGTLDAHVLRLSAAMKAIQTLVEGITTDEDKLKTSAKDKVNATDGVAFETARKKAQAALDYLEDTGVPPDHAVMLQTPTLASIKQSYSDAVDKAKTGVFELARMEKVETDTLSKRAFFEETLTAKRREIKTKVDTFNSELVTLRKATPEAYYPYLDQLQNELTACAGLANSKLLEMMDEGIAQLALFETKLNAHKAANRDPAKDSFARVDAKRKSLKELLEAKDLIAYEPIKQSQQLTQLTKVLPTELAKLSPTEGWTKLLAIETEIGNLRQSTDALKLRYTKLKSDAALLRPQVTGLQAKTPALYADFKLRLDQLEATREGDVASGELSLKTLSLLLVSTQEPVKLEQMNNKAQTDTLQAEKDEASFKAAIDVFEKDTKREVDAMKNSVGSEYNKIAYELVAQRLEEAKKDGKAGNYSLAMDKLHLTQAAARNFMGNPYEATAATGRALLAASGNWRTAVSKFLGELRGLRTEIAKQCKAETPVVDEQPALKNLESLDTLFNPVTFDYAAEVLGKSSKAKGASEERAARRAEKEKALVMVNRYQRLIESHAVLKTVADNPFSPVELGGLRRAIKSLQGAFLAS